MNYVNGVWWKDGEERSFGSVTGRICQLVEGADTIDLQGKTVMPAFIDSHCHILPAGLDLLKLNLSGMSSHREVLESIRKWHDSHPEGWLHAVQYDQTRFNDAIHLTRDQLDEVSLDRPILLRHYNGHASVANSAALREAGIDESIANPEGGSYDRDDAGRLNGVLLELAHERVTSAAPGPTLEEMVEAILRAGESMAAFGIACATDMMTGRFDLDLELQAYKIAADRGCAIRTRLCLQWGAVFGPRKIAPERLAELEAQFDPLETKIIGIKIFADGAIGSATAAIYGEYENVVASGPRLSAHAQPVSSSEDHRPVSGQLIYSPKKLREMVRIADEAGYAVAIHAIGDYAVDLVLDAFSKTDKPSKHRIEHAMLLSDEQITRMAELGVHCTFQPEFLHRFGHAYRRQLGSDRTGRLKRIRSVIDAGIPISLSSDRPIVVGDPWIGVRTASSRPEGFDSAENISLHEAIMAYTSGGAIANGDSDLMGRLDIGQCADFLVIEGQLENPSQVTLHRGRSH